MNSSSGISTPLAPNYPDFDSAELPSDVKPVTATPFFVYANRTHVLEPKTEAKRNHFAMPAPLHPSYPVPSKEQDTHNILRILLLTNSVLQLLTSLAMIVFSLICLAIPYGLLIANTAIVLGPLVFITNIFQFRFAFKSPNIARSHVPRASIALAAISGLALIVSIVFITQVPAIFPMTICTALTALLQALFAPGAVKLSKLATAIESSNLALNSAHAVHPDTLLELEEI